MIISSEIPQVRMNSYWPEDDGPRPSNRDLGLSGLFMPGAFTVDVCAAGTMRLRARDASLEVEDELIALALRDHDANDGLLTIYAADDGRKLLDTMRLLCRLGYDNHTLSFSWWTDMPGTLWQLSALQRVFHLAYIGERTKAHETAKMQDVLIQTALSKLQPHGPNVHRLDPDLPDPYTRLNES